MNVVTILDPLPTKRFVEYVEKGLKMKSNLHQNPNFARDVKNILLQTVHTNDIFALQLSRKNKFGLFVFNISDCAEIYKKTAASTMDDINTKPSKCEKLAVKLKSKRLRAKNPRYFFHFTKSIYEKQKEKTAQEKLMVELFENFNIAPNSKSQ